MYIKVLKSMYSFSILYVSMKVFKTPHLTFSRTQLSQVKQEVLGAAKVYEISRSESSVWSGLVCSVWSGLAPGM